MIELSNERKDYSLGKSIGYLEAVRDLTKSKSKFISDDSNVIVRLAGKDKPSGAIEIQDLKIVVESIQKTLERVAIKGLEGKRGSTPGQRSNDIKSIKLYLTSIGEGSVSLGMSIGSNQITMDGTPIGAEFVENMIDGINHIKKTGNVPDVFDRGVINGLNIMKPLFKSGFDEVEISFESKTKLKKAVFDATTSKQIETMLIQPVENRRTVSGVLLQVDYHLPEIHFTLYVDGRAISCIADEELINEIHEGTLHQVRVSGESEIDSETEQIKKIRVDNIDVCGLADISIPYGLITEFWTGVDVSELIDRQGIKAFDKHTEDDWEAPSDDELNRYFDIILNKLSVAINKYGFT